MESLSRQVLEANERHKLALDQYTRKLLAELDTVNKLIVRPMVVLLYVHLRFSFLIQSAVENLSDNNLQDDPGDKWCLHADGALKPSGLLDQVLNEVRIIPDLCLYPS
jgi:hypothetical protein